MVAVIGGIASKWYRIYSIWYVAYAIFLFVCGVGTSTSMMVRLQRTAINRVSYLRIGVIEGRHDGAGIAGNVDPPRNFGDPRISASTTPAQ